MTLTVSKSKAVIEKLFYAVALFFTAVYIFEIPYAVFWAPVCLFASFMLYSLYLKFNVFYSMTSFVLLVFAVVYSYFVYEPGVPVFYQCYIYIEAFLIFVVASNIAAEKTAEEKHKLFEAYFIAVAVFYTVYTFTVLLNDYMHERPSWLRDRFYISFWYSDMEKGGTVTAMMVGMPLAVGTYLLFYGRKLKKLLGLFFIGFEVAVNLYTRTRLLIMFTPVFLCGILVLWLIFTKKKKAAGIIIGVAGFSLALIAVFILYKYMDYFAEKFADSPFRRFFVIFNEDGSLAKRIDFTRNALSDFSFSYLGGAVHSKTYGIPHNVWVLIYDCGGFFSALFFLIFTVMCVISYVRFSLSKFFSTETKMLITCMLAVVFVFFSTEPLIVPLPSFFHTGMFVLGAFSGMAAYKPALIPSEQEK